MPEVGAPVGGVTDHGMLTGLLDDDHPQYLLADGTREAAKIIITDGAGHFLQIPKLTTAQRDDLTPTDGMLIYNTDNSRFERYAAGAWGAMGVTDHGDLTGLLDDDHPQYAAIAQNENITGYWDFTQRVRCSKYFMTDGDMTWFDLSYYYVHKAFVRAHFRAAGTIGDNEPVIISDYGTNYCMTTTVASDSRVIGVHSGTATLGTNTHVAILGKHPVKVLDADAVAIGDILVTSTTAGYATVDNTAPREAWIGRALTTKAAGVAGTVVVWLTP